jgi:uncharacterized protein YbaP (TraB family)
MLPFRHRPGPRLILPALSLICLLLAACASPPAPAPETGGLYLWEVAHPDPAIEGGHLFGTFHVGDGSALDPAIATALDEADAIALELSPDETAPARAASALISRGRLENGQTLADLLPEETFRALEARFAGKEVEWLGLQHMKPWVTLFQLIASVYAESGMTGEGGAETILQAGARGRPVIGLETIEEQIAIFDELSLESQIRAIEDLLADGGDSQDMVAELMRAWREGDDATLTRLSFAGSEDPDMQRFYEALYFDRNELMSGRIDALMREGGNTFVGVGAAHMLGERGIPSLLSQRGFLLRRVQRTPPASLDTP